MIGLFCKRDLYKRRYSAKETYNFKEPTNRSHPIYPPAYAQDTSSKQRILKIDLICPQNRSILSSKQISFEDISSNLLYRGRRPIGCPISCITFCKLATNYRALLRKMTYKDKASYESVPPCNSHRFVYMLETRLQNFYIYFEDKTDLF